MILYTGPSWAALSYDVPGGDWNNYTNLLKEWNLDLVNSSLRGSSNISCLRRIKKIDKKIDKIIWIYCEPLVSIRQGSRYKEQSYHDSKQCIRFLTCNDPYDFRCNLAEKELKEISMLDIPIGLIGSHSDVFEETLNFNNLFMLEQSWQKFMCNSVQHGWGVEVANNMILEYTEIKPSVQVVDYVYNQWPYWKQMEQDNLFCGNHPNRKSTEEFAKHTKPNVVEFING